MNQTKRTEIINEINKMFPASDPNYPVAFELDDNIVVTGEVTYKTTNVIDGKKESFDLPVIDYYGEYFDGYPMVSDELEKYLDDNGLFCEWENPACVIVSEL